MAVTVGSRLGPHEITALLGKGGMGEVYRARDTKLNRDVAIKVLPDVFANDPDRVARFHREAQSVAALNHPNIAAIYDLEEAGGAKFLVLELVEGETLADVLQRGPLPPADALNIAHQMCEALEAAHEKGVIHRDLKPANVKVTPEGKVKVLDFGLAKALENAPATSNLTYSPTLSIAGTQAGVILGTAAYMSPEQAKGFNTDQRSDIFAFGCVFYEMLTGRATFDGDSVSDVLASVLKSEPNLQLLPDNLNPGIRALLRRCLEKNPRRRWYAIGDVRMEIENLRENPIAAPAGQPVPIVRPRPSWKRVVPALLAMLILGALAGVSVSYFRQTPPLPITRFSVAPPEGQQFTNAGRGVLAISRDGTQMVYQANRALYHRFMHELDGQLIPGTDTQLYTLNPAFSPDGRSIAFWSALDSTLKKIAVTGGAAVTLCKADAVLGISWGPDGIVFGQGTKGIMRVREGGGEPEPLVTLKNGESAQGPQMLPGGKAVLFTLAPPGPDQFERAQIFVQLLQSGERKALGLQGSEARYLPTGHVVYAFGGTLFAVPFDLGQLKVTGGSVPVVEGVRRAGPGTGTAHFNFSDTGSLIYLSGPVSGLAGQTTLALMDRKGTIEARKIPPRAYGWPRVSPDGMLVAVGIEDAKGADVWIYELSGTTQRRQLTVRGANRYPIWTADSQRVSFQSDREGDLGIWWQPANGSTEAQRLTKPQQGVAHIPDSWSPVDQKLLFTSVKGSEAAVWIYSLQDNKETVFAQIPSAALRSSVFSPDGRWIAYQSNETGRNQIWVQPFPATSAKFPIVAGGHPLWSPKGNELFFNSGPAEISVVSINTRSGVTFGVPALVPGRLNNRGPSTAPRFMDITPDGKYFVGVVSADQSQTGTPVVSQIQVVLNWFEDLKQRMSSH